MKSILPFAGYPLDRASARRRDAAALIALMDQSDTDLILVQDGKPVLAVDPHVQGPSRLLRLACNARAGFLHAKANDLLFMGHEADGRAVFAACLPKSFDLNDGPIGGLGETEDLRTAAGIMALDDLALVGAAKSLFDWHARHGFCANCGHATDRAEGGWKRVCPSCGTEHFPRTDPVAIMLAVKDDMCLLGRGPGFRAGFISALAGFIEPGETIEQGCARELHEEAGVVVTQSRIVANQPWPFPSQLMIGLIADVESRDLTIDPEEIAEALWFTKDEARALLSPQGCARDGKTLRAPPPLAIAHHLLKIWVES